MSIAENISKITSKLTSNCNLIAVSKTKPVEDIQEAYDAGQRIFGENKAQELKDKHPVLPKDIEWHMIGHMQTNKVKYIAPFISLIHSVDSFKLLKEINKQALKNERVIDVLLQVHIAEEETKFGFSKNEVFSLLEDEERNTLENVRIVGLMGMATNTENHAQVREEFKTLKNIFEELKQKPYDRVEMKELSMGMSGDWEIAMGEGATLVRIGSSIFGARNYV